MNFENLVTFYRLNIKYLINFTCHTEIHFIAKLAYISDIITIRIVNRDNIGFLHAKIPYKGE